jgi:hypothetical protein
LGGWKERGRLLVDFVGEEGADAGKADERGEERVWLKGSRGMEDVCIDANGRRTTRERRE